MRDGPHFIVLAVVILIFGTLSAIRTPTDIFPNIGIPVVSVVWQYSGLPQPTCPAASSTITNAP